MTNHLNEITKLKPQEVREYVKQNINDEAFIFEIVENKEISVPLLLSNKILPEQVVSKLSDSLENITFLLDSFINANYIPSVSFIDSLSCFGAASDGLVKKAINSFPTIQMSTQILIKLINDELMDSAIALVKQRTEFQKPEILFLLLNSGANDSQIIELATNTELLITKVLDSFNNRNFKNYSHLALSSVFKKASDDVVLNFINKFEISATQISEMDITSEALEKLLRVFKDKKSRSWSMYADYIKWSPELEKLENLYGFIVEDCPIESKFRKAWISRNPEHATDDELVELIGEAIGSKILEKAYKELITRPINLIKKVGTKQIPEIISPSSLVNFIKGDVDKALFLLEELPSKYSQALRRIIPPDLVPTAKNKRKKSYFFEAIDALKKRNIEEFRFALSGDYTIDNFVEDTYQSSKSRLCSITYISPEIIKKTTKSELLKLVNSNIRVNVYYSEEAIKLNYNLNLSEAIHCLKKFNSTTCFDLCDDQKSFLLSNELSNGDISSVFEERKEYICSNNELFLAYIQRAKSYGALKASSETLKMISSKFTTKELREILSLHDWDIVDVIDVTGKDGEFFVTDEEILSLIENKYTLENQNFITKLISRDREFAKKVVSAYLSGNKELSKLCGKTINIRRNKTNKFQSILEELSFEQKDLVDEIFKSGASLHSFKYKISDYVNALKKYSNGRVVFVNEINYSDTSDLSELHPVNIKINRVIVTNNDIRHFGNLFYGHIEVDSVSISGNGYSNIRSMESGSLVNLLSFINYFQIKNIELFGNNIVFADKVHLLMNNIKFIGNESIFNNISAENIEDTIGLKLEHLKFLENNGLIINENLAKKLINSHHDDVQVVTWLNQRLGGLSSYFIQTSLLNYNSKESVQVLKDSGIKFVSDNEFIIIKAKEHLDVSGSNFDPIDISKLSAKEKSFIIKYIEKNIDKNYSKLNLLSSNIDTLDLLRPYHLMKESISLDDSDIIKLFNINSNISQNKKIIKGIRDLISINGGNLTYKIELIKSFIETINPSVELLISDFLDYSDVNAVTESESFKSISMTSLKTIENHQNFIENQNIILKNKNKNEIIRFLRSASSKGDDYLRDTIEMIISAVNGVNALTERLNSLISESEDETQISELKKSIDGVTKRIQEVAAMDDIEHMHDRLVPLLSFLKSDPVQLLGQDKFKKLERSAEISEKLGFNLFFPKTRGDLQYLGDNNGWCVNYHRSYGDGVINKGNILVGICEPNSDSCKENVIALAHYLNKGKGKYQLEQLKWSSRKKGNRNVDATSDFNYGAILCEIKHYLDKYEQDRKNKEL